MEGFASLQSPWQAVRPSPSLSASLVPASDGQPAALQSLLSASPQICGAPGYTEAWLSSQSPLQPENPSPSLSASLVPAKEGHAGALQLLFRPSQTWGAPG